MSVSPFKHYAMIIFFESLEKIAHCTLQMRLQHEFKKWVGMICLVILPWAASPLGGQTDGELGLADVLQKVEEANGGESAIEEVRSLRLHGTIERDGEVYDFTLVKKRPEKVRISVMWKQRSIETGYDGETAWQKVEGPGGYSVEELTGPGRDSVIAQSDFDGVLLGEPASGIERRLLGKERVDRVDCYVVEVDTKNYTSRHYLDERTFREIKVIRINRPGTEEETEVESRFEGYFKEGNLWLAGEITRYQDDKLIEKIEITDSQLNPGIFNVAFEMPEEPDQPGSKNE